LDIFDLIEYHDYFGREQDISEIFYQVRVKFALLSLCIKPSFMELIQYFLDIASMFGKVI